MWAGVPTTVPVIVRRVRCSAWLIPKSPIFTAPSFVHMMFCGLMSRWITPLACAAARPFSASSTAKSAISHGKRPVSWRRAWSSPPSTYSMTMYAFAGAGLQSTSSTMFGCLSEIWIRISWKKRSRKSGSVARWGRIFLRATRRPVLSSTARKISAIPPSASRRTIV